MEELIPALIFVLIVLAQGIATMLRKNTDEDETRDENGEVPPPEWEPRKASPTPTYPKSSEAEPEWRRVPPQSQPRQSQPDVPKYGAPKPVNKPTEEETLWEKMAREFLDAEEVYVEEEPQPKTQPKPQPKAKPKPSTSQPKPKAQKPKKPVTQYTKQEAAQTILSAYSPAFVNLMKQAERYPMRTGIIFTEIMKRPRAARKFPRLVK